MVGREVNFKVDKNEARPTKTVLSIRDLVVKDNRRIRVVDGLSLEVKLENTWNSWNRWKWSIRIS